MPDSNTQQTTNSSIRPLVSEPAPFTEYGDNAGAKQPRGATKGKKFWLLIILLIFIVPALAFSGLLLWKGELVIAGMTFVSPWQDQAKQKTATTTPTPTPIQNPVLVEKLLQPLKLSAMSPRIAITQADTSYFVNYEGGNRIELPVSRYAGMIGSSNRCLFYTKEVNQLYRSAIDGSQEQLVLELDAKLFEVPKDFTGDVGPGFVVQVLGVDENCQQAVVEIHINTATESMPADGIYLITPEQKAGLVRIDSDKSFIEFRGNKPWFVGNNKVFTVNVNGVPAAPYSYSIPDGFYASAFSSISTDGVIIDSIALSPDSDLNTDPVSGQKVSGKVNKVVEANLQTGVTQAIASDSPLFYQQVITSPNFEYVFYAHETGEMNQNRPIVDFYIYNRQDKSTHKLNLPKGSLMGGAVWLDEGTVAFTHYSSESASTQSQPMVTKCSSANYSCQNLITGELIPEFHR